MTTAAPSYPNRAAALRAKLLAAATPENKPIKIDGETFHIRTALIEDRRKVMDLAGATIKAPSKKKKGATEEEEPIIDVPIDAMLAAALVLFAVDEVGNPLFSPVDMDVLRKAPVGSTIEKLARACLEPINSNTESEAGEE